MSKNRGSKSLAANVAALTPEKRRAFLSELSPEEAQLLQYSWEFWARPEQLPPKPVDDPSYLVHACVAGRGFGKNRMASEWVIERAKEPNTRIALVARTAADVRDTVVEGESGILARSPPWFMPNYEPSKRRITWPNGSQASTYSAEEPDVLRGPQHGHAFCDEVASWSRAQETWDNLMFGLRLGKAPKVMVTTTPRPIHLLREILKASTTVITRGSTYDNIDNLSPTFAKTILEKYEGTSIGRQEIEGELLDETPGALWTRENIESTRVREHPALSRIVVAVDPAVTDKKSSDECGIVVVGLGERGGFYVLDDLSLRASPDKWARVAVDAYVRYKADRIVAEVNQGGDLVEKMIRQVLEGVSYKGVHASKGKYTRAEPIAARYEQKLVHHVGVFPELEDQLCTFSPQFDGKSPDRLDALCWGLWELDKKATTNLVLDVNVNTKGRTYEV